MAQDQFSCAFLLLLASASVTSVAVYLLLKYLRYVSRYASTVLLGFYCVTLSRPIRQKIRNFGDVLPSQSLGLVLNCFAR